MVAPLRKVEFGPEGAQPAEPERALKPLARRRRVSPGQGERLGDVVLDATLDAVVAHRPDGSLVYFNRAAHEMLGYTREEFADLPHFGWVAPINLEGGEDRLDAILGKGWLTFESGARHRNGATIPTEVRSRRTNSAEHGDLIVSVIRDITERRANQRQLHYMAFHDQLTGLANRAQFDEALAVAIADVKRHEDVMGLAFLDLDDFKPVNDTYGHSVGDAVLVEVGQRIDSICRRQDTVARIGGDEFVVLLPRLRSEYDLGVIGKKLCAEIDEPIRVGEHVIHVHASAGLAVFDPEVDTARSLLVKADLAMYEAKRNVDGPRYVVDSPRMRDDEM